MEGQIKCFPDKVKLREFIITKPLLYEMLNKGTYLRKRRSKIGTVKMTANSIINNHTQNKSKKLKTYLNK